MGTLIAILAVLFLTLIIGLPLLEKYGTEKSPEELNKLARYITPLMIILILASAARFFFF
ncbi:MAG: hypothetical protein CMQ15_00595 [Gammaproteobacteria bacterium]|jgi:preprotein translocase subunit SecG|nr:hypothetical protein [Gammaproteobacteria bacterium]HJN94475.1 hypothetical protein [Gammaproteobacteria bacterium]|tara:strand:+ start:213 stop:392 length:180 start_codon:yes stop_codon:yes gene_type:complete